MVPYRGVAEAPGDLIYVGVAWAQHTVREVWCVDCIGEVLHGTEYIEPVILISGNSRNQRTAVFPTSALQLVHTLNIYDAHKCAAIVKHITVLSQSM